MKIKDSMTAASLFRPYFKTLDHEECHVIYLTSVGSVIDKAMINVGSLDQTVMDTRRIVKNALLCNAKGIIVAHNHVSGCPTPSNADLKSTELLHNALNFFDIDLVDHIITGNRTYFSFADGTEHRYKADKCIQPCTAISQNTNDRDSCATF